MNTINYLECKDSEPLKGFVYPPKSLFGKLTHYVKRYGFLHAITSYIGRKLFIFWTFVGPLVTKKYLQNWLKSDKPLILNLGGGNVLFDRWLTADVCPSSDVYMDITKPLPIPDKAIDVIYSEEAIEHIPYEKAILLLQECFRVLKSDGYIRLTTPSLDYFCMRALQSPEYVQELNDIFYCHYHKRIFSEKELELLLASLGFVNIYKSSYRDPSSMYGYFDSHAARHSDSLPEWSQYWEAQKP